MLTIDNMCNLNESVKACERKNSFKRYQGIRILVYRLLLGCRMKERLSKFARELETRKLLDA